MRCSVFIYTQENMYDDYSAHSPTGIERELTRIFEEVGVAYTFAVTPGSLWLVPWFVVYG